MLSPLPALSRADVRLPASWTTTPAYALPVLLIALTEVVAGALIASASEIHVPIVAVLACAALALHAGGASLARAWRLRRKASIGRGVYGFGALLVSAGMVIVAGVNPEALVFACALTAAIVVSRVHALRPLDPLLLALIHGLTLLLGLSAAPGALSALAPLAVVPAGYAVSIGLMQQESTSELGVLLALGVVLATLAALMSALQAAPFGEYALPGIALLALQVLPAFAHALADRDRRAHAHRATLCGLVVVAAALVAAYAGPWLGLAVLAMHPVLAAFARPRHA